MSGRGLFIYSLREGLSNWLRPPKRRCEAITIEGTWCKLPAVPGSRYCQVHTRSSATQPFDPPPTSLRERLSLWSRLLVRKVWRQVFAAIAIGVIVFVTTQATNGFGGILVAREGTVTQIFSTLAQVLAALLALLIAFLVFELQRIHERKSEVYRQFRSDLAKLDELASQLPDELATVEGPLREIVDTYALAPSRDLAEWDHPFVWTEVNEPFLAKMDEFGRKDAPISYEAKVYFTKVVAVVVSIEHALNDYGVLQVTVRGTGFMVTSVVVMIAQLGTSLLTLPLYGFTGLEQLCPSIALGFVVGFISWVLIALLDLFWHLRGLYINL